MERRFLSPSCRMNSFNMRCPVSRLRPLGLAFGHSKATRHDQQIVAALGGKTAIGSPDSEPRSRGEQPECIPQANQVKRTLYALRSLA